MLREQSRFRVRETLETEREKRRQGVRVSPEIMRFGGFQPVVWPGGIPTMVTRVESEGFLAGSEGEEGGAAVGFTGNYGGRGSGDEGQREVKARFVWLLF
ncbi:hypothetical protein HAX54_034008 [Datura stramonium]|uniref:Uncharacterized protein n=1 Tax=Datura stramonium TaxID=4076 RepID=A0ABS8VEG7_DATST|nr:hypothetical protein [Datura stramonium]